MSLLQQEKEKAYSVVLLMPLTNGVLHEVAHEETILDFWRKIGTVAFSYVSNLCVARLQHIYVIGSMGHMGEQVQVVLYIMLLKMSIFLFWH